MKKIGYVATGSLGYNPWGQVNHLIWQDVQVRSAVDPTIVLDPALPYLSFAQLSGLVATAHANGVKVLVCLGGPYNNGDLNAVTASPALRAALVNNLRNLIYTYNLDGLDIDWESGPNPETYAQFVKELKTAMPDKIISVIGIFLGVNIASWAEPYIDIVNIMSYDYWVPTYGSTEYGDLSQVAKSMNLWAAAGFPRSKLVMGIPLRTYPWGSYAQIVDRYNPSPGQNLSPDGAYAWNGPDLVAQKAAYVKANGFGGIFFYELSLDKWNDPRALVPAANKQLGP